MRLRDIIASISLGIFIGLPLSLYAVKAQESRVPDYMIHPAPHIEPYELPVVKSDVKSESPEITISHTLLADEKENTFIPLTSEMNPELQEYIFNSTEGTNVSPFIVIAICEHESHCNEKCIGDNGNSLGIMQIQPRWHEETLRKLNITDLLDDRQCISVGIEIIKNISENNEDINWILMCYNGGPEYANNKSKEGIVSDYAQSIIRRAQELEKEYGVQ